MNKKIPELTEVTSIDGTELINYVIDSTDRVVTVDNLANKVAAGGDLFYVYREMTPAELSTMFSTPVDLVDAQGFGTAICPHMMVTVTKAIGGGTAWDEFNDNVAFKFSGGTQYTEAISSGVSPSIGFDLQYCNMYDPRYPFQLRFNSALQVYFTNGNAQGSGTKPLYVHVWYYVISV